MSSVLVTGGAGYIGSHAVRCLAERGYHTVSYDNLSYGHREAVGEEALVVGDLADEEKLESVFQQNSIDAVMHFAALASVGESVTSPELYYQHNVADALTLLRVMLRHGVRIFILSSTCAIYGDPVSVPMDEGHPQQPISPYGESKLFLERILAQYDRAHGLKAVCLRYFNAAGASLDAHIGESHEPETHLIPRLLKAARGELERVDLYGDDYPTPDGSCIRDYIHVLDLADAHLAAYRWLQTGNPSQAFNLGSGQGYSVKQVVDAAQSVTGVEIPLQVGARRSGDPPRLVANPEKIGRLLDWKARYSDLETILGTAWSWEQKRRY